MASIFDTDQRAQWQREGWVLVRGCFDADESAILRAAIEQDPQIATSLYDRRDAEGRSTRMTTWNHPGDSVYGLAARSRRIVDTMECVLGGEVYHYHSKLTAKEPLEGGAWEWHQDYGYWYHNGCLKPDMASVMLALDAATRENGCLQVISGSHLVGRVDHGILPGEQVGADPQRVAWMLERLPLVHVEMAPGDALYFHANVMHRSDANRSPHRRWTLLFCFNAAANDPLVEHHHPRYTPLVKVDDGAVRAAGIRFAIGEDANFRKSPGNPKALDRRFGEPAPDPTR